MGELVKIFENYDDELKFLEQHIRSQADSGKTIQILEAGCGREWYFKLDDIPFELTGLDLDSAALDARRTIKGDMTYFLVGDLRTAELKEDHYDVIYNAFVLEHIEGAALALSNFVRWLKPGGILIVRVPDRDSAQGFFARITPHWVHVLYYRWAWKMKNAGKPGFAPYRTVYDSVVSTSGLLEFCASNGLIVIDMIGVGSFRRGYGLAARITPVIARLISVLSFGRVHAKFVDLTIIARKPSPTG
jgi:SAM-dependent methyltransferase